MPVEALDHVNVITADLEGSVRFYTELFGLEPRDGPPPLTHENARWMYDAAGRAVIHLNSLDCARDSSGVVSTIASTSSPQSVSGRSSSSTRTRCCSS